MSSILFTFHNRSVWSYVIKFGLLISLAIVLDLAGLVCQAQEVHSSSLPPRLEANTQQYSRGAATSRASTLLAQKTDGDSSGAGAKESNKQAAAGVEAPAGGAVQGLISKDPTKPRLITLREAVKSGQVSFKLEGDGVTTTKVRLVITNKTEKPLKCIIPANECFHPNVPHVQIEQAEDDTIVDLTVGEATIVDIATYCVSTKTIPPPPPASAGVDFSVAAYGNEKIWKQLASIIAASKDLSRRGYYDDVPLGKTKRREQITQLAIWRLLGGSSSNPEDKVTPETIEAGMIKEVGEQVKKNPSLLQQLGDGYALSAKGVFTVSKKQKEVLDGRVDKIFTAIDLTLKRIDDPNLKGICSLPLDQAWDTFCNVGERAFGRGNYIEAEELLKSAMQEAEKFGETDPRYSRTLTSLGLCYLELSWTERAEQFLSRALAIREKLFGQSSPEVAESNNNMGQLKQLQNLYEQAGNYFSKALSILEKSAAGTSEAIAETLNNLGRNFNLLNDGAKAEPALRRALAIAMLNIEKDEPQFGGKSLPAKTAPADSSRAAEIETNLATAYLRQGKYPEAAKLYNKALATDVKQLGEDHPYVATIIDGLAELSDKQDHRQDAEDWKKKAQAIREKSLGKENLQVAILPFGSDALTRIQAYTAGSKGVQDSVATLRAAASLIPGASADKTKINRPIKDKWALVIGISKFKDPSIALQYASKDAKDFAKFLTTEENFRPDHVRVLTDEKATRENILSTIGDKWLPRVANPDDLVVIFISSHGSPSEVDVKGANFLIAYNTDKNNLYATGIGMGELTKMIKDRCFSDRVVVFLDACHSGATETAGKGLFRIGNFDAESVAQGCGQLVVCSSLPKETSWESKRYANGVFTHCLMESLRKNGVNTKLKEAFETLKDKVQEEVIRDRGVAQSPLLKTKWDGDDLVVGAPATQVRPGLAEEEPAASPQASPKPGDKSTGPGKDSPGHSGPPPSVSPKTAGSKPPSSAKTGPVKAPPK